MSISDDVNNNNNNPDTNINEKSASIEEESPEGQESIETDNLEKMILSTEHPCRHTRQDEIYGTIHSQSQSRRPLHSRYQ